MSKNTKVATAIEEMILPVLGHAEVYWADHGQSAMVVANDEGRPYFVNVEVYLDDVRTFSSAGDEWETGWDA